MNKAVSSIISVILIVCFAIVASAIAYYYQEERRLAPLEVIKCTSTEIVVKNVGGEILEVKSSNPPASFNPSTILQNKTSIGKFEKALQESTIVTIATSGGKLRYKCP